MSIPSRNDLLANMGIIKSYDELESNIEYYILKAAEKGKREILYRWPDTVIDLYRLGLKSTLTDLGYIVNDFYDTTSAGEIYLAGRVSVGISISW